MNSISGKILSVQTSGSLSLVTIEAGSNRLTAIVIDTPDTSTILQEGHQVKAIFKETEVAIGLSQKDDISLQNQLSGDVKLIEESDLLSKVVLQIETNEVSSIITTQALKRLKLTVGSKAVAFIKTNEIMLSE